jgi:hypothetical protein
VEDSPGAGKRLVELRLRARQTDSGTERVELTGFALKGRHAAVDSLPRSMSRNYKPRELRFCALLTEGATRQVELVRA